MTIKTFLVQTAPTVCSLALTSYFFLELISYFDFELNIQGSYAICKYDFNFSQGALTSTILVAACFFVSCFTQVLNLFGVYFRNFSRVPYFSSYNYDVQMQSSLSGKKNDPEVQFSLNVTTFTINLIAGSSSIITFLGSNHGACKDSLG